MASAAPPRGGPLGLWRRRLASGGRQRVLALASIEGVVVSGMFACTEFWLVPMAAVRLQASVLAIGMLAVLPILVMAVVGPWVGRVIEALGGERRALVITCAIQTLALAALVIPVHAPSAPWAVPLTVALVTLTGLVGAIGGPAWVSVMATVIPPRLQGRFTTGRLRLFLATKLLLAVACAGVMHLLPLHTTPWGFDLVLLIAVLSRAWSTVLNGRLAAAAERLRPHAHRGPLAAVGARPDSGAMRDFLRELPRSAFGRWTLIWALLHVGVALAGPYFTPYMLVAAPVGLGLAAFPLLYIILVQTGQLTRLLVLPAIGRMVDRFGAPAVLRAALIGICLLPLPWAVFPIYPAVIVAEVWSGICWCMAECAVAVLLYNCDADPRRRTTLIACNQSLVALAIVLGGGLGAGLLAVLPELDGSAYRTLFVASSAVRVPAVVIALWLLPALALWRTEARHALWRAILGGQPPITGNRGLLRFLRRPEG